MVYDYSSINCRSSLGPYEYEKSLNEKLLYENYYMRSFSSYTHDSEGIAHKRKL
jgi:hypothetical protein